jgi:hypothetical protein
VFITFSLYLFLAIREREFQEDVKDRTQRENNVHDSNSCPPIHSDRHLVSSANIPPKLQHEAYDEGNHAYVLNQ